MPDFMTRLELDNFDAWLATDRQNADNRRRHRMPDGPTYRDIGNPNAVVIHTSVEDLDLALQRLQSEASQEVTARGAIRRRQIYLLEEVDRPSNVGSARRKRARPDTAPRGTPPARRASASRYPVRRCHGPGEACPPQGRFHFQFQDADQPTHHAKASGS